MGIAAGVLIQISQGTSWKTVLTSLAVAALGAAAKDANKH
jgi:hypothetical protein